MAKIHKGMINDNVTDAFKDSGLNNYDLATTKLYKGVKPMWKHLGFESDDSDIPYQSIYWKNHIPRNFDYFNLSGITTEDVEVDTDVGVSKGSKIERESYTEIIIDEEQDQNWNNNYLYPILPKLDVFGAFLGEVNTINSYGSENASITTLEEDDINLILNVDFNQRNTNDVEDLTNNNNVQYIKDFEVKYDDNLRIKNNTLFFPDSLEDNKDEQAF